MPYSLPDLRPQADLAKKTAQSPQALLDHVRGFKLAPKFSVGIWYFSPGASRFHETYAPARDIRERLKMIGDLADKGVTGVEAHFPGEINEETLPDFQQLQKDTGIRLVGIPFSHFYSKDFEFGSLSNPDPSIRQKAIQIAIDGLKMVKATGAECAISWPGIDGYTYSMGTLYHSMWDSFESGLAEAMDAVPGVRVALEPKPYEPAPNNIYRNTADGLLMARDVEARLTHEENLRLMAEGHALACLNPEMGHVKMGFEDPAYSYARVLAQGRLAHTHWNSQPAGNYDQDLNVGVVGVEDAEALAFVLKMYGYTGWYGIDINPERMPVARAVELNIREIRRIVAKVEALPWERIVDCYWHPDEHRGDLEEILQDARR